MKKSIKKSHPPTPSLSQRNRTFSSSRTAAAALGLPPELLRLARVRGGGEAFTGSSRVKERSFVEWLLLYLHDRHEISPPVDNPQAREGFFESYNPAQLFEAPEATVRRVFCEGAASFQVGRILWGDEWGARIAEEATELLAIYSKDCDAIKRRVDQIAARHNLPLSLVKIHTPEMDLSKSPFDVLGISHFGFWAESEKIFPRGPKYCHDSDCSWEGPIDLESNSTWVKFRMVPCCIISETEYQRVSRDYKERGYLLPGA